MNKDIFKGKWGQIKGRIQKQWGKITDDDLAKIKGDTTRFKGILQEKYGYTKQEAEKMYDKVFDKGNSFRDKVNTKKEELINSEGKIRDRIPGNEYLTDDEIIAKRNEEIATYRQQDRFEDKYFERQGKHRTGAELLPEDYENLNKNRIASKEMIDTEKDREDYLEGKKTQDGSTETTPNISDEELELNAKRIADKYYHEDSPDHDDVYKKRGEYVDMKEDKKDTNKPFENEDVTIDKYYHGDEKEENREIYHRENVVEVETNKDYNDKKVYDSDADRNINNTYEKDNLVNPDEFPTTDEQKLDAELVANRDEIDRQRRGQSIDHIHEEDTMVNPDEFPTTSEERPGADRFAERAEIESDLYGIVDEDLHTDRRDIEEGVYDRSQYTEKNMVDRGIYEEKEEDYSDLIVRDSEVEGQPLYKEDGSNRPHRGEVTKDNMPTDGQENTDHLPTKGEDKFKKDQHEKTVDEFYKEEAEATEYIGIDNKIK